MAIFILGFLFFNSFYVAGCVFKSFELFRHLWLMVTLVAAAVQVRALGFPIEC
jgi:hypothetical protein